MSFADNTEHKVARDRNVSLAGEVAKLTQAVELLSEKVRSRGDGSVSSEQSDDRRAEIADRLRAALNFRAMRSAMFPDVDFQDIAWNLLLDLACARIEHRRVSVTSACIASGAPPTTALRWISQLTQAGILERTADESDPRRAYIAISDIQFSRLVDLIAKCDEQALFSL